MPKRTAHLTAREQRAQNNQELHTRPQKIALSPLEGETLWMLEEAGSEALPTILTTVTHPNTGQFDALPAQLSTALTHLQKLGYISFDWHSPHIGTPAMPFLPDEIEPVLIAIPQFVRRSATQDSWEWDTTSGNPFWVEVVLTCEGRKALTR